MEQKIDPSNTGTKNIPLDPRQRKTPKKEEFWIGRRIYYTGDMANIDDNGTVTAVHNDNRTVDIELDDGRIFHRVYYLSFAGPGHRFEFDNEREWRRKELLKAFLQRGKKNIRTHTNEGNQKAWCSCTYCGEPAVGPDGFCKNCGAEVFSEVPEVG